MLYPYSRKMRFWNIFELPDIVISFMPYNMKTQITFWLLWSGLEDLLGSADHTLVTISLNDKHCTYCFAQKYPYYSRKLLDNPRIDKHLVFNILSVRSKHNVLVTFDWPRNNTLNLNASISICFRFSYRNTCLTTFDLLTDWRILSNH